MFDVNETLSDTTALAGRFEDVGAPAALASTWFAQVLRDGFALIATADSAPFAEIAATLLDAALGPVQLSRPYEEAKTYLLDSFAEIPLHPDVAPGVRDLAGAGVTLVALTNGAAATATTLLEAAGVDGLFEHVLSVEDAPSWKPGAASYRWAAERCRMEPSDVMLVAVHPWDIHGADRAGLRTAWVNRDSRAYPSYFIPAELDVSSVTDLARQVV
ncbi:MAG: haloacid dehalogenase type II [Janthinobacterium lividum]